MKLGLKKEGSCVEKSTTGKKKESIVGRKVSAGPRSTVSKQKGGFLE